MSCSHDRWNRPSRTEMVPCCESLVDRVLGVVYYLLVVPCVAALLVGIGWALFSWIRGL